MSLQESGRGSDAEELEGRDEGKREGAAEGRGGDWSHQCGH